MTHIRRRLLCGASALALAAFARAPSSDGAVWRGSPDDLPWRVSPDGSRSLPPGLYVVDRSIVLS